MLEIIEYNKDEYSFPCLLVLGCFDAIHEGHSELFKKAKLQAKINGLDLGVMMFYGGKGGKQVFTFEERIKFLEKYNVKFILKIDFNDEFKKIKPLDFLATIEDKLNVKAYMSGKDFRFGAGAKGKSATLKKYAEDEENGVWYMPVKDILLDGEKISTTLIKECLAEGNVTKANKLLGHNFYVCGTVINGAGRGASLGFPTVNIAYPENKVEVKYGVYKVESQIDGVLLQGVANYGPRPTFDEEAPVLEVYFNGYNGDLYGKDLTVSFIEFIRDVQKFESAEQLSAQLTADVATLGAVNEIAVVDATEETVAEVNPEVAEPVVEDVEPEIATAVVEEVEPEEVTAVATEEATEEYVAEVVEEVAAETEAVEQVAEETTDEIAEETAEEIVEEATEEAVEETTEETVAEVAEETEVVEEAVEEITEEAVEEITEEAAEETTEEVAEESTEEYVAEVAEETEVVEEAIEETTEEVVEETTEDIIEEPYEEQIVEETTEDIIEEPYEEQIVEETTEEVAEQIEEVEELAVAPEEVAIAEEPELDDTVCEDETED